MASVRRIWAIILIAALLLPGFNALAEATSQELEAAVQEVEYLIQGEDAEAEAGAAEAAVPESESFELSDAFGGQAEEKEESGADETTEHTGKAGGMLEVHAYPETAEVNTLVTFVVVTTGEMAVVAMHAENGAEVKRWDSSYSTLSGSIRTWTLSYAFSTAGNRSMVFTAGKTASTMNDFASVAVTIVEPSVPAVTSVAVAKSSITAGEQQTFTVKTPSTAKYLKMYAENGTEAGAWEASGNSSVSGSERTWTVKQVINSAGDRTLTFKASADGSAYGAGRSVSFTVTPKAPGVTSASAAKNPIAAGEQQTFTVKTSTDAVYLRMYAEDGTAIATWRDNDYSSVSGSTRTWMVKLAISSPGDRTLTFKASADGKTFGEGRSVSFTVSPKAPAVTSVAVAKSSITAGEQQTFTVRTPSTAKYLKMYAENGTEAGAWEASGNSSVSGSERTWTLKKAIGTAGSRTLTFRASADGSAYGEGRSVSFTVTPKAPGVTSASAAKNPIAAGEQQTFTVKTSTDAVYLRMYAEDGTAIATWRDNDYSSVSGSTRTWMVKLAISSPGDRTLTFKASADGKTFGDGRSVSFTVSPKAPAVTSVAVAKSSITAGEQQTFTVKTPSTAKYLKMYAENGTEAGAWEASGNSSVSGSKRTWTLKKAIGTAGSRTLTFRASADGSTYGEGRSVSFTVTPKAPGVTSASAAKNPIAAGEQQTFTVKTSTDAVYLRMYAEDGTAIATWRDNDYSSVSGSTRTWMVKLAISSPGDRTLTFKASADGKTFGEGRSVSFKVIPSLIVSSVSVYRDPIEAGTQQTFWATTSTEAAYLRMYAEDGTAIATWNANGYSSVSGDARSWTVKLAISAEGDRTLTFKVSADGKTFGAGRSMQFTVNPPAVSSATVAAGTLPAGEEQTFTVRTPMAAKHLRMYAENDAIVGTWEADGSNSVVSGDVRIWTVKQAISSPGDRTLTFRASAAGSRFGAGVPVSFIVKMMEVTSVAVGSSSIMAGTEQTFTVKTSGEAAYLRMFAEDGTAIATWSASGNSTLSGSTRTWTVKLAINAAGSRSMLFKASADGKIFGDGKPVTFTVNPPSVTSATASPSSIEAGGQVEITALTPQAAKYLRVYAEDETVVWTWTASAGNSSVSGSTRTWKVKLTVNAAGSRELFLKASTDNKTFGNGVSIKFNVIPSITSLTMPASVTSGCAFMFSVETQSAANYIGMFDSSGAKIKSWRYNASGVSLEYNRYDDSGVGLWTIPCTLSAEGTQSYSICASLDGVNYGAPMSKTIAFISGQVITNVTMPAQIISGTTTKLVVETTYAAKYVALYDGSGSMLKTWYSGDSAVTRSGSASRGASWTMTYDFTGSGTQTYSFRASTARDSGYGPAVSRTVSFQAKPTITSLTMPAQAERNMQAQFTVVTQFDADYVGLYDSSDNLLKYWKWNDDSVDFTGNRAAGTGTWLITHAFDVTPGTYTYSLKASQYSSSGYGAGKSATIRITAPATGQKRYALVIGQAKYSDSPLPDCKYDADNMAAMLRGLSKPFNVTARYNRTAAQIKSDIASTFANATSSDLCLLYYTGHGAVSDDDPSYMGALCGMNSTYLKTSELAEALNQVPCKVIVLLDSCHSGAAISSKSGGKADQREALRRFNRQVIDAFSGYTLESDPGDLSSNAAELATSKFIVITACTYSEESSSGLPVSVFTYALLDGLGMRFNKDRTSYYRGSMPADANSDKKITLGECYDYTRRVASQYDDEQNAMCYGSTSFELFSRQ